ncbi:hypothetical protein BJ322DRAFT_527513 [Thelephora terrestris]|uniref:Uncharacterized protein n=1 Tax=Thelephora terrestris TaxID=56493 RepID=A0A9P6HLW6_9AGAM|nr:hypothetical protein BJ322DRAFT_527513 [Thelephora terrestris]
MTCAPDNKEQSLRGLYVRVYREPVLDGPSAIYHDSCFSPHLSIYPGNPTHRPRRFEAACLVGEPFEYVYATRPCGTVGLYNLSASTQVSMSVTSVDLQNTLSNILRRLDELDRKIDIMNRNFDLLLIQSNADNGMGGQNPFDASNVGWNDPSFGEMCGRPAGGTLHPMGTPPHTPGIVPGHMDTLWRGDPSYFEESNSLGITGGTHQLQSDLVPLPGMSNDISTLPHMMAPASTVDVPYNWIDQVLPQTFSAPIPLPPVTPGDDIADYGAHVDGGFDGYHSNYTGYDHADDQFIQPAAVNPAREPESSVGLAVAVPDSEQGDTQESCSPVTLNPKHDNGKRAEREDQKARCVKKICDLKKIECTGDRLTDLQNIIEGLGWNIPQSGLSTRGRRWKENACKSCYEELRKHVGPWTERIIELSVLENVLAMVRRGGAEPPEGSGSGRIVFSL